MSFWGRRGTEPLWRDEFSIFAAQEGYVTRRQFSKFLVLTSAGMFVGQLWILFRAWFVPEPVAAAAPVARVSEVPVGGVALFRYPGPHDPCILIRTAEDRFVAYSQKCTHLSCAVHYAAGANRLECPCHEGYFAVETGRVLQGPPPRPLPRILLERDGDVLTAVGVSLNAAAEA